MIAFATAVASGLVGFAMGIVVDEFKHYRARLRADDALVITSAEFAHIGPRTQVTVVVRNGSDSTMTLTGGLNLIGGAGAPSYVLEGSDAGKIRAGETKIEKLDDAILVLYATLDGRDGLYDLAGFTIRVHAGSRKRDAQLVAG